MLHCDFHLHSYRSGDCNMSLDTIVRTCVRKGINCIAITDHNTFASVRELQRIAPFPVIAAEEIKTTSGEVIGLFIQDEIPRGLSIGATVEEIRRQGGLIYVPHPFDRVRKSVIRREALLEIVDEVDVIETYNSRILFKGDVRAAEDFAIEHGKLTGAGSDAHVAWELGQSYVEMPEFTGPEDFLQSLAQGTIHGRLSAPAVHFASTITKIRKRRLKGIPILGLG